MSSGNMSPTSTAVDEPVRKARFSLPPSSERRRLGLAAALQPGPTVIIALFKPVRYY
jgi:hypothetical protein